MNASAGSSVETLEPKSVWRFFAGIAAVPRPSKHEEKIREYVKKLAGSLKLAAREDGTGNIVIEVPATKGFEKAAPVVIQGHLDMVCEKNSDVTHDFDRDPIKLVVEKRADGKQIVRAAGTTLGADNGIGVSLALAAATDPAVKHGPLEILCTVDEETGMTGAKTIDPSFFKGRRMLNLDSEEDDAIYIGCAGGVDSTLTWSFPTTPSGADVKVFTVAVTGLKGGHSGCDIHLNRGNAIALLARVLEKTGEANLRLGKLSGGSKRNAIPREASAVVGIPGAAAAQLSDAATAAQQEAVANGESDCRVSFEPASASPLISPSDSQRVICTISALPHGVLAVVPEIPGLVQTSNGTTILNSESRDGKLRVEIGCLSRSSSQSDLMATADKIAAVACLAGAEVERSNEYPGWAPNVNSPTLSACRGAYERAFGRAPRIASIHAGLECGIIGERVSGMDMVSFGPNIQGAHSPNECVEVASVGAVYKYLASVLEVLAKNG